MSLTAWLLLAAASAAALKLGGYLLPQSLLDRPPVLALARAMTIGLLASLTVLNTLSTGTTLHLDARLCALVAAALALALRAPYILVVFVGALAAAVARALGMS
ncbi:hypothetical protein SAMN05443377_13218 [Propionibacterium cyclohexanicum]|uniref:Branched-chain amino acid transport protein (AzlD) n=1 Tax=Propionibacterium cyclohexanicum TaxID=64702 RepID=A0A1H9TYX7_9ACTN|nr:branched-chain amino acid transporter AzlD [Propionibacterium cyclohexanicum]SES02455.1 hypothetical protein SAMN05443377_13218 [Propionibacterium cyclohexanicum]